MEKTRSWSGPVHRLWFLALALLLSDLSPLFVNRAEALTQTLFENFESQAPAAKPTSTTYTYADTGSITANVALTPALGNRSFTYSEGSAGQRAAYFDYSAKSSVDFCGGGSLKFAIQFASFGTGSSTIEIGIHNTARDVFNNGGNKKSDFSVTWNSAGNADVYAYSTSGGSASAMLMTFNVGVWYNVTLTNFNCGSTGVVAIVNDTVAAANASPGGTIDETVDEFYVAQKNSGGTRTLYVDNLDLDNVSTGVAALKATYNADNLIGFSVDPTGATVIVRETSNGLNCQSGTEICSNVTVLDGASLAVTGGPTNTRCSRLDGVLAIRDAVMYVNCNDFPYDSFSPPTPGAFSIRDRNLQPLVLSGCDTCPNDILIVDNRPTVRRSSFFDQGGNAIKQIGEVAAFPISYTSRANGICSILDFGCLSDIEIQSRQLAWSFSSTTGYIGIDAFTHEPPGTPDTAHSRYQQISGALVDQLCTFQDSNGQFYIGGSRSGSTPQILKVNFTTTAGPYRNDVDAVLTPWRVYSAPYTDTAGISCGSGLVAFQTKAEVYVTYVSNGTNRLPQRILTPGSSTVVSRPVALSGDGKFVAFVDTSASRVRIYNVSTATSVVSVPLVSGVSFRGLFLDYTAQNLWQASNTKVERYEVFNVTTGTPAAPDPQTMVNPQPTAQTGLLAGAGDAIAGPLGLPPGFGNLFMGVIMVSTIALGTVGAFLELKITNPKVLGGAAFGGALIGILMAIAAGFWAKLYIFLVCVGIVAIFFIRHALAGRGAGGD